jgi:hypothetical protein
MTATLRQYKALDDRQFHSHQARFGLPNTGTQSTSRGADGERARSVVLALRSSSWHSHRALIKQKIAVAVASVVIAGLAVAFSGHVSRLLLQDIPHSAVTGNTNR